MEGEEEGPLLAPQLRGDIQAVMKRVEAMGRGIPPDPASVCAPDGEAPLHPLQQESHVAFLAMSIASGPTAAAVHKAAAQANRDVELAAMKKQMVDLRPLSDSPRDLCSTLGLELTTWDKLPPPPHGEKPHGRGVCRL